MRLDGVGSTGPVDASAPQTVVMAKKALDAQKQSGEAALQLIATAVAPPVKEGHSLSVYA